MSATRLCLVRHGETAWNAEGRVQGQLDVPLSEVGRAQARAVAAAPALERFDAIYSSDLVRVRPTAAPAAERLGMPVAPEAALRRAHALAADGADVLAIGGAESDEFHRQSADLAAAWRTHGVPVQEIERPGLNHFSILADFADPRPPVTGALMARMAAPRRPISSVVWNMRCHKRSTAKGFSPMMSCFRLCWMAVWIRCPSPA